MAFKNLEQRYEAKMDELYQGSARIRGDGGTTTNPIIEKKPGESNTNYGDDSRSAPFRSIATDAQRMTKWTLSDKGLRWMADQTILQTGNTFTETRLLNPIFVVGNTQPFIHLPRSVSKPSNVDVEGNSENRSTPTAMGTAGRLQVGTSKRITSMVISGQQGGFLDRLAGWIPPVLPIAAAGAVLNILELGALGIDQRPEFDVYGSGNYDSLYSSEMWKGLQKTERVRDPLSAASANLRRGKISAAISDITNPQQTTTTGRAVESNYFIIDKNTAYRYLDNSIEFDERGRPLVNFNFAKRSSRLAYTWNGLLSTITGTETNAVDELKFPELSVEIRYKEDTRMDEIRRSLPAQGNYWKNTYTPVGDGVVKLNPAGFGGGVTTIGGGDSETTGRASAVSGEGSSYYRVDVSPNNVTALGRRYFFDPLNMDEGRPKRLSTTSITKNEIDNLRENVASDLIDLLFFDYVNKVSIPFRAYITNLQESSQPEFMDNFYIGRTERNIVYVGNKRSLNFQLKIYAFNENELVVIWDKLNYLRGLTFPAEYSRGFIVPPFVKLTLGDMFNNQPGYIKGLTYRVEDETPWETTPGFQVPHGVTVDIQYEIIEKGQPRAPFDYHVVMSGGTANINKSFYWVGLNRQQVNAPAPTVAPAPTRREETPTAPNATVGSNSPSGRNSTTTERSVVFQQSPRQNGGFNLYDTSMLQQSPRNEEFIAGTQVPVNRRTLVQQQRGRGFNLVPTLP